MVINKIKRRIINLKMRQIFITTAICLTIGVVVIFIFTLDKSIKAFGSNCGDGVAVCGCGDIVAADYTFPADLNCDNSSDALFIGANNITIDGNGHKIANTVTHIRQDKSAIKNIGYSDITIKNLTIEGLFDRTILFDWGGVTPITNINFINNTISDGQFAVNIYHATDVTMTGNIISNCNSQGIDTSGNTNVNISDNTFLYCVRPLVAPMGINWTVNNNYFIRDRENIDNGIANIFTNNHLIDNAVSRMINWTEIPRLLTKGNTVNFNFDMNNFRGVACPSCTYTVNVYPTETIIHGQVGNSVSGSFIVNNSGTYTLQVTITDPQGNYFKKNYIFLVDATGNQTTRYYFTTDNTDHGQGSGSDAKALKLAVPLNDQEWACDQWIGDSVDDIPDYPLAVLDRIDYEVWYRNIPRPIDDATPGSGAPGVFALDKMANYDFFYDIPAPGIYDVPFNRYINPYVLLAPGTKLSKNFTGLNIPMDYFWSWYNIELKYVVQVYDDGPAWQTFTSSPSYADFKYFYSTTPAIKSASNSDISILAATQSDPTDPKTTNIILEGTGSTDIILDSFNKPFIAYNSRIDSAGTTTISLTGLSGITTVNNNFADMSITPSAGYIDVRINYWNMTGDHTKRWTESGVPGTITANHIVNDLKPSTKYYLKINGVSVGDYTSDGTGQIIFNYTGGYSTKVFELATSLGGSGASSSFNGDVIFQINNSAPSTDSQNAILNITSETAKTMLISNDPNFADAQWQWFEAEKSWVLSPGLGHKIVYAYFKDESGNVSKLYSAEIELVEKLPEQGISDRICVPVKGTQLPEGISVGDLIKVPDITTVYFISCDYLRLPFPNEPTYFTWYPDFRNIKIISPEVMTKIKLGKNMTVRPGTALVKIYTMPNVYAVEPGAELREIPSEEIAKKLYGLSWHNLAIDIPDVFFIDYNQGEPVSELKHPTASVIQYQNSSERYYIENGQKRLITPEAFNHNLFLNKFTIADIPTEIGYQAINNLPLMNIADIVFKSIL